jgi:hypothetical protein
MYEDLEIKLNSAAKQSLHFRYSRSEQGRLCTLVWLSHHLFKFLPLLFWGRKIKRSSKSRDLHTFGIPQVILNLSHDFPFRGSPFRFICYIFLFRYTVSTRKKIEYRKRTRQLIFIARNTHTKREWIENESEKGM